MTQLWKRALSVLLCVLLLGGALSAAGAAFDPAVDGGSALTMAVKAYRQTPDGDWIETTRAKPGEALKLRFFAATDYATNNFDMGFAYDRQFFTNSMEPDTIGGLYSVNPALEMLDVYTYVFPSAERKAANARLKRMRNDGRLTAEMLEANDFVLGGVEWKPGAVNAALPADTWLFEIDSLAVADNDYVRMDGRVGAVDVPAALGVDASAGLTGLYGFPKGEPGAQPTENAQPGNGWTPTVASTPAALSVFSSVTFDANGGSFGDAAATTVTGVIGTAVPAPAAPTRDGWQFAGYAPAGSDTPLTAADLADVTFDYDDQTFHAVWTAEERTVYYYYYGAPAGYVDPAPAEGLLPGDAVPLPVIPAVPGYTVTDWALEDSDGPMDTPVIRTSDVYASAVWKKIPYTVTYEYTGEVPAGATPPAAVTAGIGDAIDLPTPAAVPGYVFAGWTLSGDDAGKVGAGDVTVTGAWQLKRYTVTYVFDGQAPTAAALPAPVQALPGDTIDLPAFEPVEGYTFEGWTLVNDANGKVGQRDVTAIGSWRIHTHRATFLADAETTVASDVYAYGASIPAPEAPQKPGFVFTDWYSEAAGVWTAETCMGDADLVFTARYAEVIYTVTYLANGETAATQTVPAGEATMAPAYTAPAGFGLRHWADAAGSAVAFPFTPTADTTLTAVLDRAENGLFYQQNANDEIVITGLEFGRTAAEIPAQINGRDVTAIAANAFAGNAALTSVSIPKSVTVIGANAFDGCNALADVTYGGTAEDWDALRIGSGNDPLLSAERHCHVHQFTVTEEHAADCAHEGWRIRTCSCGERETETLQMTEHTHGYWVIRTERGVKEEICTVCGKVLASEPYEEPPVETKTPRVQLRNNPGTLQLPYRYSLVLTADAADLGTGQAIAWYVDGVRRQTEPVGQTTGTLPLEELRSGVTVTVKIVDANGNPVAAADGSEICDTETVEVGNGFFARLVAFFRALFRRLRTVEQMMKF